jgi:DNA-directed RNA polymerase specialized sigma24 family protein
LRRLAAHYLQDEHSAPTLQATALVHELYLRISSVQDVEWQSRGQFISVAAQIMRRILIDHARKR